MQPLSQIFQIAVAGAFIFTSFIIATLVTNGLRKHFKIHRGTTIRPSTHPIADFLSLIARSAIVLVISISVYWALRHPGASPAWHDAFAGYLRAWILVWLAAFGFAFLEALVVLLYRFLRRPMPLPELLRNILRSVLVVSVFFAVLKYNLGINIGTLLASTALITAVVGFALQGVLSNLMSGMSMHLVRSVFPGDWISVDETTEGEVIETNWRETRLRTIAGHIMIIPNSRMAGAIVHNMTQPTPRRRHSIMVRAGYSDPPGEVFQALVDAAKNVPGIIYDPEPSAVIAA